MRDPKMVVEYLPHPAVQMGSPPYVRGVFVADHRINSLLRQTEPKGHDAWDWKAEEAEREARNAARRVKDFVGNEVRKYKKFLKPPSRPAEQLALPVFDRWMKRILIGGGVGPVSPSVETRPVTIRPDFRLEQVGDNQVRVLGRVRYRLSEHFDSEEGMVEVSIRYRFLDDDRVSDSVEIKITPPKGFLIVNGKYQGPLRHDQWASFKFQTAPYPPDWSGRLFAEAAIIRDMDRLGT